MPRILFICIITSSIVSALTSFLVIKQTGNTEKSKPGIESVEPAQKNVSATPSIVELDSELQRISGQLSQLYENLTSLAATAQTYNPGEIEARFTELELQLKKLELAYGPGGHQGKPDRRSKISEIGYQNDEALTQQRYVVAEQDFMDDSGPPIGRFADSINDIFHGIEGIEMTDMECGSSVCKVTYDSSESLVSSGPEDVEPEWQIMDNLLEVSGDKLVDIRHAVDSSGNTVMYIRLR